MQCREVVVLLSAYYDGELSADNADTVAAHVAGCADCAAELETLRKLSDLTMRLDQPSPPRQIWPRIEAQLNTLHSPAIPTAMPVQRKRRKTLVAVVGLLMVGLCWISFTQWHAHEHHHQLVNFGHFLDRFVEAHHEAQRDLVRNYSGVPVEISDSIRELKYRPVVADGLPVDYELAQAYLLKMPCCRCLEACYRRKDGGMLCVFEHEDDQPMWFGDRPTSSKVISGKPTRLVKVDGFLAATWQQERRHITLIGATDVDEVARLIAHFDRQSSI